MRQFNLTYKGIIKELLVEGTGSKKRVRVALENASINDLENLKRSIQEEIRNRKVQADGKVVSK